MNWGHNLFSDQYQRALEAHDARTTQELELRCGAIAVFTLADLGLNPRCGRKRLARTKLAKSITDAAFGEFRRQLEYKTIWNRKHLAVIDRWYPSSKTCHVCGAVNDALTLADRSWTCTCGAHLDRDLNAGLNIRAEGLKILAAGHAESNARGPSVRLPQLGAVGVEA